jgi:hypothetical protein
MSDTPKAYPPGTKLPAKIEPTNKAKKSVSDSTSIPPEVLSGLLVTQSWLSGKVAGFSRQPKSKATEDPTTQECDCPNPCANLIGPCIMICSGGQMNVLFPPLADAVLAYDAGTGTFFWSSL